VSDNSFSSDTASNFVRENNRVPSQITKGSKSTRNPKDSDGENQLNPDMLARFQGLKKIMTINKNITQDEAELTPENK
jgi:hypothetical protein